MTESQGKQGPVEEPPKRVIPTLGYEGSVRFDHVVDDVSNCKVRK